MPNWKKVIVSGSDAALNSLNVTNGVTITGSLNTSGSNTFIGTQSVTGSLGVTGGITANLTGTASYATQALSSSYAATASFVPGYITGSGAANQVAFFSGTNNVTSSATFAFTPTSQLLVNNSVTAASAIARGINATPSLTAAANNDVLLYSVSRGIAIDFPFKDKPVVLIISHVAVN